jgi:hypothetical protein
MMTEGETEMNKIVVIAALAGAMVSTAAMAQNRTGARLIDGNVNFDMGATPTVTTTIPSSNVAGITSYQSNLRVNNASSPTSGIDNAYTTYWFVRSGNDAREFGLANPTSRAVSGDGRSVTYSFEQSGLTWTMSFVAQSLGADSGQVLSSLTATNNGTAAVANVNMFWYVDSFLFGQDANDLVTSIVTTGDRRINIVDTAAAAAGWSAQVAGFGATGLGAGTFAVVGSQMTDTGVDNFADINAGGAGVGSGRFVHRDRRLRRRRLGRSGSGHPGPRRGRSAGDRWSAGRPPSSRLSGRGSDNNP